MSLFESKSVKTVRRALAAAGSVAQVVKLDKAAPSVQAAASMLGVAAGAIVKMRIFMVGGQPVLALIAGDRQCAPDTLPRALNLEGEAIQANGDQVKAATGFSGDGLAPVGMPAPLPTLIDVSLKRFGTLYVPAGHPRYLFTTGVDELKKLTGGIVSYKITEGEAYHPTKVEPAEV